MVSKRVYEFLGLAAGFVLIDYGFSFLASGLPGARILTSQFIGANIIIGGSAAVFGSLYYLLRPVVPATAHAPTSLAPPDIGVETIVEEEDPPKSGFYRNIAYIGYFFTFLGLVSAADLVLQVFIPPLYNEGRWWVEILLVVFGVLAYTIFGSVGQLGKEEESKLSVSPTHVDVPPVAQGQMAAPQEPPHPVVQQIPATLEIDVHGFSLSTAGEYERHISSDVWDAFRLGPDIITVWREERKGMRSTYLAGPYELSKTLLEGHFKSGEELRIGSLRLSPDSIRDLLALRERLVEQATSPAP